MSYVEVLPLDHIEKIAKRRPSLRFPSRESIKSCFFTDVKYNFLYFHGCEIRLFLNMHYI